MSSPSSQREDCTRSGVILSCYLDGRKLFRAVRLGPGENPSIQIAQTPMSRKRAATKGTISTTARVRRHR